MGLGLTGATTDKERSEGEAVPLELAACEKRGLKVCPSADSVGLDLAATVPCNPASRSCCGCDCTRADPSVRSDSNSNVAATLDFARPLVGESVAWSETFPVESSGEGVLGPCLALRSPGFEAFCSGSCTVRSGDVRGKDKGRFASCLDTAGLR